jgi:hypothetical protein
MPNASGPSTTITRRFIILQASCGRMVFGGPPAVKQIKGRAWSPKT